MGRSLEEILADLNNAEKEYAEKCKKYGIEEKHRKKKVEVQLDENGNPIVPEVDENGNPIVKEDEQVQTVEEPVQEITNNENKEG